MAALNKLSDKLVSATRLKPGTYQDGGGLFLKVAKTGSRSWIVRLQGPGTKGAGGKIERKDYGLGGYPAVSLSAAREKAAQYREWVANGKDPKSERSREFDIPTFEEAARTVYDANKGEWKNAKHRAQWWSTLETYAFPVLGGMRVRAIDTDHVLAVLAPMWTHKPETARRVRQRIMMVLDWSHAKLYRDQPLHIAAVNKALPKVKRMSVVRTFGTTRGVGQRSVGLVSV